MNSLQDRGTVSGTGLEQTVSAPEIVGADMKAFRVFVGIVDECLKVSRRDPANKLRYMVAELRNALVRSRSDADLQRAKMLSAMLEGLDRKAQDAVAQKGAKFLGPTPEQRRRTHDNPVARLFKAGRISGAQLAAAAEIRLTIEQQCAGACCATADFMQLKVDTSTPTTFMPSVVIDQEPRLKRYRAWLRAMDMGPGPISAILEVVALGAVVRDVEGRYCIRNGTLIGMIITALQWYVDADPAAMNSLISCSSGTNDTAY